MSLNIKNERTHALVRELATVSGMSQTDAVEDAVRRRLDELARSAKTTSARVDSVMALAADFSRTLPPAALENTDEWLYDENGLPR